MLAALIDAIYVILISCGLMGAIFGLPMYFLIKRFGKNKPVKRYPFKKPAIFTNKFGHLIMVEPDEEMYSQVQSYFTDHPNEKKKFFDGLKK